MQWELDVRSGWTFAVLFLLDLLFAPRLLVAEVQGLSAFVAADPSLSGWFSRAMHTSWLGPGLILAAILLVTLRRSPSTTRPAVRHNVPRPRLERYRGARPRLHRDLEV